MMRIRRKKNEQNHPPNGKLLQLALFSLQILSERRIIDVVVFAG